MSLALVLLGLHGFPGSALACKGHVPAFVLSVLQSRVVIFQNNLSEYAVPATALPLATKRDRQRRTEMSNSEICYSSLRDLWGSVLFTGHDGFTCDTISAVQAHLDVYILLKSYDFIAFSTWQTLLSKVTYSIMHSRYTFDQVFAFPGNRTHDLGISSVTLYCLS